MLAAVVAATSFAGYAVPAKAAEQTKTITASPSGGKQINLLSGDVYDFVANYDWEAMKSDDYYDQYEDIYMPDDVQLTWEGAEGADNYHIDVATNAELKNAKRYSTNVAYMPLNNLQAGTRYYYRITACYGDREEPSEVFDFVTTRMTRTLAIDGVSNTRDMGGYVTEDKKHRVKQGMAYRGGNMDLISELGAYQMLSDLYVKTDLDLRAANEGMSASPLGSNVNYIKVSGPFYAGEQNGIHDPKYREALATEIRTYAKAENYPIYVHCAQGKDRTGTICFLINGLLGVGKADLYLDYELSYLSVWGQSPEDPRPPYWIYTFSGLYDDMANYGDGSLAENIQSFMIQELGITAAEIQAIKDNLLEENSCDGNHALEKVAQVNATCSKAGTKAYYKCESCGKLFADVAGKTEIAKPVTIARHKATRVKAVAATYAKTGMREHYRCSCGKLYTDAVCTKATTKAKLTIAKLTVPKTSVKKVTGKSKALAVNWSKKSGVTGYEVQVALKKNFKSGVKKATVKGASKTSVTVKTLKAKKTYYVRVRAYKKVGSKTYYSAWSAVKTKKTK